MIILNHIYPNDTKRELIRSAKLVDLQRYATDVLDDYNLTMLFEELDEWKTEGRILAPMTERLSTSLELVISEDITE